MPNKLMRAASGDSREHEIPDRMFQDGAMSDFEDVVQINFVPARPRSSIGKITQTAGDFREIFSCYLCVRFQLTP